MNTEEKAKAYDEAVKRAKAAIDVAADKDLVKGIIGTILPELKESEDERIRKSIIHILQVGGYMSPEEKDKAFAYLEKQKDLDKMIVVSPEVWDNAISDAYENGKKEGEKQKEPLPIPDKFSGLKSLMLQYLQSAANRKDDTEIESDTDLWGRKILDYVWKYSDEQKEQKPAEKQDYSGLNDLERAIHRGFLAAGIENVPVTIIKETAKECLAQMKPAKWGENDENMLNSIINVVCGVGIQSNGGLREKQVSWLKSIPERFNLQPKEEWSERDKQDFDDLIMRFGKSLKSNRCYFTSYDVDWLKSKLNGNSCK